MKLNNILITLGSNIDEIKNISEAKAMLKEFFGNLKYSTFIWTQPIGIDTGCFLNGLAYGETHYDMEQTVAILKDIEQRCGSLKEEKRMGIVRLDLDLMKYGETICHVDDWKRTYVQELYKELNL
ncbi:MAG: 2-amino-4-hydroxy-6-hydroxymethyldihydropteridine diphosphokinase [Prevotella sp.]